MSRDDAQRNDDDRLPMRWAVIIAVSIGTGLVAGHFGGPIAGLTAGLAVMALMHQILGR